MFSLLLATGVIALAGKAEVVVGGITPVCLLVIFACLGDVHACKGTAILPEMQTARVYLFACFSDCGGHFVIF